MEDQFYTRPTGRLKSARPSSYGHKEHAKKDQESVYSLENYDNDYFQHPTGCLSTTQTRFIKDFMRAITCNNDLNIDTALRSIHKVGLWDLKSHDITVSCTMIQPHITACTMVLSGMTYTTAETFARSIFSRDDAGFPSLLRGSKFCQVLGRYSIPFSDALLERKLIEQRKILYSNVVLSKTQLMFCVVQGSVAYECKLSHASCKVMADTSPKCVNISHPVSTSHNFAFRSPRLRAGSGTGPSITVHTSGSMQYNGSPLSMSEVVGCFRECIHATIKSQDGVRFLRSLCIVREFSVP